jgi:hypothetical protein
MIARLLTWLRDRSHEDCQCHVTPAGLARALARQDARALARLDGTAALDQREIPAGAADVIERMRQAETRARFLRGGGRRRA